MKKFEKGFLGPIGDDLPSLIPLVFALIMFFYAFTFAWNAFDSKNSSFEDTRAVLGLSRTMSGNSYIDNFQKFSDNCDKAKSSVKRLHFIVGLVPLSVNPLSGGEYYNKDSKELQELFFKPDDLPSDKAPKGFFCSNTDEDIPKIYSVRFMPVALERNYKDSQNIPRFFVKPMLLVVISWR